MPLSLPWRHVDLQYLGARVFFIGILPSFFDMRRSTTYTVTLAGHSRVSKLQAGSADPPVSARQGASVPSKLLHSSQSSSFAAASTLRCTSSADRTSTSSQHLRSVGICCRWSDRPTVRRCLTLCLMIYDILQSAHRPSDSRWRLIFSLPISTFSALGVSHVMRSINVRYLLTYFLLWAGGVKEKLWTLDSRSDDEKYELFKWHEVDVKEAD